MSNENNSKQEIIDKITSTVAGLQKDNPKILYGVLVVLVMLFIFNFVGSGTQDTVHSSTALVNGNTYTMLNPNGGETLLLSVPTFGSAGSGDDMNICLVDTGTSVKLDEQTVVNYINYVKVSPTEGSCQGKSGWTSKVNIKL